MTNHDNEINKYRTLVKQFTWSGIIHSWIIGGFVTYLTVNVLFGLITFGSLWALTLDIRNNVIIKLIDKDIKSLEEKNGKTKTNKK